MTVLAAAAVNHTDTSTQLVIAALFGIATVVVLIVWLKVHRGCPDFG
jgi:GntP family gluconate:H+ symporter